MVTQRFEGQSRRLEVAEEQGRLLGEESVGGEVLPCTVEGRTVAVTEQEAPWALVKNVSEQVIRPAAVTSELVRGGVRAKPSGVFRRERVADGEAKGGGGGMTAIDGEPFAGIRVDNRLNSFPPQRVVVAARGL